MIRKILLGLYPAAWRKEYGEEFADVISACPLTLRAVANVLSSALWQRLRGATPWLISGALLLAFSSAQIMLGRSGLLSLGGIRILGATEALIVMATSAWIAARKNSGFSAGVTGTVLTALISLAVVLFLFYPTGAHRAISEHPFLAHSRILAVAFVVVSVATFKTAILGVIGAACGWYFTPARKEA